jgi:hypothetical protein
MFRSGHKLNLLLRTTLASTMSLDDVRNAIKQENIF